MEEWYSLEGEYMYQRVVVLTHAMGWVSMEMSVEWMDQLVEKLVHGE